MCGNLQNIMFKVLKMFEEVSRGNKLEEPNKCTPKKKKKTATSLLGVSIFRADFLLF